MPEREKHQYLLKLQFLGFRYSGWQQQPGERTIEGMLRKTLRFVLPGRKVGLLGAGRTDARVSATDFAVQLNLPGPALASLEEVQVALDANLPPDIVVRSLQEVPEGFNAIRDATYKVYRYYFTFGEKPHPFCAPLLGYFPDSLDIGAMKQAAPAFVGRHDFSAFITRPSAATLTHREVSAARIERNNDLTASFFPEDSYFFQVEGQGFGRYQVRNMMAALVALGRGVLTIGELVKSLQTGTPSGIAEIAPSSGLQLLETRFSGTVLNPV